MANASLGCERLEPRRLLSADVADPTAVDADLPVIEYTSDVVIAPGRQQIYPPLAPAGWVDESVGSFEQPEAITVAFFPPDPVDETPVMDNGSGGAAPAAVGSSVAAQRVTPRPNPIAREVLGGEDDAALVG
jgi:hypothetical protein